MKWCTFFFAILPVMAMGQTAVDDTVSALIVSHEAGIVCSPPTVGTSPAPDTLAGETHLIANDPPFVSTGRRVPAVLGIGFGVKSQALVPTGIADVTMTITHPEMGELNATSQTYQTRISGADTSLTFYQFDFDYEMVLGRWQMQATQGDTLLYSTSFDVVSPSEVPELARICGFEEFLS